MLYGCVCVDVQNAVISYSNEICQKIDETREEPQTSKHLKKQQRKTVSWVKLFDKLYLFLLLFSEPKMLSIKSINCEICCNRVISAFDRVGRKWHLWQSSTISAAPVSSKIDDYGCYSEITAIFWLPSYFSTKHTNEHGNEWITLNF